MGGGYLTSRAGDAVVIAVLGTMLLSNVALAQQASMSLSEIDAFRQQLAACWSPPADATNAADLRVLLKIWLNPDGSLARPPEVIRDGVPPSVFQGAAESAALRSVSECAPFSMPVDKYAFWREIEIRFDPSQMFGR